jgi:hypothetical protein
LLTLNKNIKLILNYFIGPFLFCVLVYSIYQQLQQQPNWKLSIQRIWWSLDSRSWLTIFLVVVLMMVNWGIEARKWQLAISQIQRITFVRSFKAIFTGTTLAFFTPNRMGEYIGRILYIDEGKRIHAIALTIACSMAQLQVTLLAGSIGLLFMKPYLNISDDAGSLGIWINILICVTAAAALMLGLLYFRLGWLLQLLSRIPPLNKYVAYIRVLDKFNATILLKILSLCFLRYSVFVLQYYLFFRIFKVEVNWWQTLWSISVVFLILAIVPSIALLTELGIRWKASIELVAIFSSNITGILAASLAIWIINLVIPALIGSLLILGIKFFKK